MFSQAYGYTLDVSTRDGLVRMRRAALWTFVSVLWSRGIRYAIIGARLLDAIKRAGHERMYTGGVAGLLGMMIFNAVVIADCARRLWKFGACSTGVSGPPAPRGRGKCRSKKWSGTASVCRRPSRGDARPPASQENPRHHRRTWPN